MAEILVYATNPVNPNTTFFKKYDIIAVEDDGHQWSPLESLDTFIVFRIPNETKSTVGYLTEPLKGTVTNPVTGQQEEDIIALRRYFFNYDVVFTADQLAAIKNSNWLLYDVPLSAIQDKAALL